MSTYTQNKGYIKLSQQEFLELITYMYWSIKYYY